jgi:hypothetical protein
MDTLAAEYRRDASPTLLSLVQQRDWLAARQYALAAAAVAEAKNDVGDMLRAGDDLERFNEFAIAGRLLAKGGRLVARTVGLEWDGTDLRGKTILIEQRIFHLIWPVGENHTPWYPDVLLVRKQARDWTETLREVRSRLLTKLAGAPE